MFRRRRARSNAAQALQISNGDVGGLVTPLSGIVHIIVALILLFPLIRRLLPSKPLVPVLSEAAHEIEEAHHHTGLTDAVSVERRVGDEARRKPDSGEPSGD